jgi:hypothetical protein
MIYNRTLLTSILVGSALGLHLLCAPCIANAQNKTASPDSLKADTMDLMNKPKQLYEKHSVDLGFGLGLDYGGLPGVKLAYLPIPYLSVFASGGYYLIDFGWNVGVTWHILPSTSRYTCRPNLKLMYGVNGGTKVKGASEYDKIFYGVTAGAGLELMFGRHKKNGLDIDVNFPFHDADYYSQIDDIKNDKNLTGFTAPLPVAFSIGFHHEF